MRYFLFPFRVLYLIYAFALFILLMIPVFIWSLVALGFGRIRGGNLIYYACVGWAHLWFALIFIRHQNIYLENWKKNESFIFVANHISFLDAALIPRIFSQPVRPLGKVEMARIPLFGTIYKNVIVTVDRSNPANRARSVQVLKAVLRQGISILVFPEGTFNETENPLKDFYNGAFRIAIETGTPIKPVLFLDMHSRMPHHSIFSLNPGKSRAVFLPAISVKGYTLEELDTLKQSVYNAMAEGLQQYQAAWINNT